MELNTDSHIEQASIAQLFRGLASVQPGLAADVGERSVSALNHLLARTMALRDLYRKANWQASGANCHELHLLFDKHHNEQKRIVDMLAERVHTLGGVPFSPALEVAEETDPERTSRVVETPYHKLQRLAQDHELLLVAARPLAREARASDDLGTHDMIVDELVPTNEQQSWFVTRLLTAPGDDE